MTILLYTNPMANDHRLHPTSTIPQPESPHQDREAVVDGAKKHFSQPLPPPQQEQQQQQRVHAPTAGAHMLHNMPIVAAHQPHPHPHHGLATHPAMRVPEHFHPQQPEPQHQPQHQLQPQEILALARGAAAAAAAELRDVPPVSALARTKDDIGAEDNQNDARSEISALKCGSVPPDPYYNPAEDPFLRPVELQIFVPPTEISVRIKMAAVKAVDEEEGAVTKQPQRTVTPPPEWLRLPSTNATDGKNKKKKWIRSSRHKSARKKDGLMENDRKQRRSTSLEPSSRSMLEGAKCCEHAELHRSLSEEDSPPAFAIKPGTAALYQDMPATTPSSPSSYILTPLSPQNIVIGKYGRPMFDYQEEELPTSATDATDAMIPSLPFSESYDTSPTIIYESSSSERHAAVAQDGVEIGSSTSTSSTSPSKQAVPPRQRQQRRRKGMVRRELQRRLLWFTSNSNNKKEFINTKDDLQPKSSSSSKGHKSGSSNSRDKKPKAHPLTLWKQSSGSCMV